jgi:TonB family protein
MTVQLRLILSCLTLAFVAPLAAAQITQPGPPDDRARAIELLKDGDAAGAGQLLQARVKKEKNDVIAWHWLAVAFERQGKSDDARKAHEKAAKLGDGQLANQSGGMTRESFGQAIARIKPELALAAQSADAYMKLAPNLSSEKLREWAERAQFLHDYETFPQVNGLTIYKATEVTTRLRIISKPEPAYTEEARQNKVGGMVRLRAILAEDGTVRAILPVNRLPHGLTGKAIAAARQIKFVPAIKDGRPVSVWVELEYSFYVY